AHQARLAVVDVAGGADDDVRDAGRGGGRGHAGAPGSVRLLLRGFREVEDALAAAAVDQLPAPVQAREVGGGDRHLAAAAVTAVDLDRRLAVAGLEHALVGGERAGRERLRVLGAARVGARELGLVLGLLALPGRGVLGRLLLQRLERRLLLLLRRVGR